MKKKYVPQNCNRKAEIEEWEKTKQMFFRIRREQFNFELEKMLLVKGVIFQDKKNKIKKTN